jgi:catechol O-methyltransferase
LLTLSQFDDGREIALLHFVYGRPDLDDIRGEPRKVLAAIDEYARTQKYLMNVGEDKGKIVTDLISEVMPQVMVELGGYVGYSCILFGDAVRKAGGKKYFSLERNPEFAAVIASLVDLAGLSDIVEVVVGSSDVSIRRLHSSGALHHIDLMFLDHYKPAYTTDLKLCEELKLVIPGTVLAADNVIKPGNPPYLEYVRSSVEEKSTVISKGNSVNGVDTRFADRTSKQYLKREGEAKLNEASIGNPKLVYESNLINSFEPTGVPVCALNVARAEPLLIVVFQDGVEVTRCIREEL